MEDYKLDVGIISHEVIFEYIIVDSINNNYMILDNECNPFIMFTGDIKNKDSTAYTKAKFITRAVLKQHEFDGIYDDIKNNWDKKNKKVVTPNKTTKKINTDIVKKVDHISPPAYDEGGREYQNNSPVHHNSNPIYNKGVREYQNNSPVYDNSNPIYNTIIPSCPTFEEVCKP
jgi:hypothetical protein